MDMLNPLGFLQTPIVLAGDTTPATTANVKAAVSGGGVAYSFSPGFRMMLNGQLLTFRDGVPYSITADILAAIQAYTTAASITMTAL